MDFMGNVIAMLALTAFIGAIAYSYIKNVLKLITALKETDYGLIMIFRIVGIFMPLVGVIMGWV